jgi:Xaa-Pro aminopeptidase
MLERAKKLRAKLVAMGLDAFVAVGNAYYLSGTTASIAVITSSKEQTLICSRLEFDRAKGESAIKDVAAYSPHRVPLRSGEKVRFGELWLVIAERLHELNAREIGFDALRRDQLRKMRNYHDANYREMPNLIAEMRMIKSAQEIACLKKSAALASLGMKRAAELIEKGRTELEIAAEVEYDMRKAGSDGIPFDTIVASGKHSWLPHAMATKKCLRYGELVVVDLGARYEGYVSDMTRTFALSPTRKQLKLLDTIKRSQKAALARVRDGVRASDVDAAARRVASLAGYARFYLHSTGHGVGLDVHEPPSLSPRSTEILRSGMVTTVEPGAYVRGVGGARWEDMVLVTKRGRELLTKINI